MTTLEAFSPTKMPSHERKSRSERWLLDPTRGLVLPAEMGFVDGFDKYNRPQHVNLLTVCDYYKQDIVAFDRLMLPETNRKMPPFNFQRVIMREFVERQFLWIQMMRAGGKTSTIGRAVLDYCLMNPGTPAILTGPSYRQALLMFDEICNILELEKRNHNGRVQAWVELKTDPTRNTIGAKIVFKNGSTIQALPMGDGSKIRGLRGGVLVIDEAYQMTQEMYESHILPFVLVEQGGMPPKVVYLTTSWYQDCFAWERLLQIASEVKAGNQSYGILNFDLEMLRESGFPLSKTVYRDARRHGDPVTYAMTFFNIWPSSGSRWYSQNSIDEALSAMHEVKVELERPEKDESTKYFIIVDLAASDKGDSTFLTVVKWDGEKATYVYAKSGRGIGPHERAWLTHELRKKFKPEFIIYDQHGAIGTDFRDLMSREKLLIDNKVKKVEPIVHVDDYGLKGARLLVPVNHKHPFVIRALTGMPKGGNIEGDDGMNELLHTKCRDLMAEGKLVGPSLSKMSYEEGQNFDDSDIEAGETVRTAFTQLAGIGLKKDLNGKQMMTKNGKLVFYTKSGAHDDGAMTIVYSTIGILRLLEGESPNDRRDAPAVKKMTYESPPALSKRVNVVNVSFL